MDPASLATDYAILSDLHLAEGKNRLTQHVSRLENFHADRPFERFLQYLQRRAEAKNKPWTLIFNGDMLDFLRVTSIPDAASLPRGFPHLSPTKRRYGLGTSPAESKWQLERIVDGHPVFFLALARFLLAGNHVLIIKGNHDVNWFWPEVRYRFIELMQDLLAEVCGEDGEVAAERVSQALDRIQIKPWVFLIEDLLYVEHGNQYDSINVFRNFLHPLLIDPTSPVDRYELDLPFGSFFVRYFFNKVETHNPRAANYLHASYYFYTLWRRHFYETWNIVRHYFPYFFRTLEKVRQRQGPRYQEIQEINRRHIREIGKEYGRQQAFARIAELAEPPYEKKVDFFRSITQRPFKRIGIAVGGMLLLSYAWSLLSASILSSHWDLMLRSTAAVIVNYLFILLGLLLLLFSLKPSKVGASYREAEPQALRQKAARIAEILKVRYVVFGHSHVEDLWKIPVPDSWYLNTGTWTPIIDEEPETIRPEVLYPVVIFENGAATLMQWNDRTGEIEELPILEDRTSS